MAVLTLSTYGRSDPRTRHFISQQFCEVSVVMSTLEMRKYRVGEVKDFPRRDSQAENGTPHPGLPLTPLLNKKLSFTTTDDGSKAKHFCCPMPVPVKKGKLRATLVSIPVVPNS